MEIFVHKTQLILVHIIFSVFQIIQMNMTHIVHFQTSNITLPFIRDVHDYLMWVVCVCVCVSTDTVFVICINFPRIRYDKKKLHNMLRLCRKYTFISKVFLKIFIYITFLKKYLKKNVMKHTHIH